MTDKGTGARVVHWVKQAKGYWLVVLLLGLGTVLSWVAGVATNAHELWKTFFEKDATKLFVTCEWGLMPTVYPPDGRIRVLDAVEVPSDIATAPGRSLTNYIAVPGSRSQFEKEGDPPTWAYKCLVNNYSNATLFNVVLQMQLTFWKPMSVPGQANALMKRGVTQVRPWIFDIDKLDSAPGHDFVFYIANHSPRFVQVELSKQGSSEGHASITVDQPANLFAMDLVPVPFDAAAYKQ